MIKRLLTAITLALITAGCAQTTKNSIALEPGMTKKQVLDLMGAPEARSFRGEGEAWQYQEIVGFGQCSYIIVWLNSSRVTAVTSRSGPSIAGCGLGSREVDWGQMPKPSIDVNLNIKKQ